MADLRVLPADIPPPWGRAKLVGGLMLAVAGLLVVPIVFGRGHEGLAGLAEMPAVEFLFGVAAAALVCLGLNLLISGRTLGGSVRFHEDGFTIHIRGFFGSDKRRFDWAALQEIALSGGGRVLFLRPVVGGEFRVGTNVFSVSQQKVLDSLAASAVASGYRLEVAGRQEAGQTGKRTFSVMAP